MANDYNKFLKIGFDNYIFDQEQIFWIWFGMKRIVKNYPKDFYKRYDVPEEFYCKLSKKVMTNPVLGEDGYFYEKLEYDNYIRTYENHDGSMISPATGFIMGSEYIEAVELKDKIEKYYGHNFD